jgi:hypothetical protein
MTPYRPALIHLEGLVAHAPAQPRQRIRALAKANGSGVVHGLIAMFMRVDTCGNAEERRVE